MKRGLWASDDEAADSPAEPEMPPKCRGRGPSRWQDIEKELNGEDPQPPVPVAAPVPDRTPLPARQHRRAVDADPLDPTAWLVRGPDVYLRRVATGDAAVLHRLQAAPKVRLHFAANSLPRTAVEYEAVLREAEADALSLAWAVVHRRSGRVVGRIDLREDDKHVSFLGKVLVSVFIDPECQGEGLGTQAVVMALRYYFDCWHAGDPEAAVHASIWSANRPSVAFFQRAGFIFAERFDCLGQPVELWAMDRRTYTARLPAWPRCELADPFVAVRVSIGDASPAVAAAWRRAVEEVQRLEAVRELRSTFARVHRNNGLAVNGANFGRWLMAHILNSSTDVDPVIPDAQSDEELCHVLQSAAQKAKVANGDDLVSRLHRQLSAAASDSASGLRRLHGALPSPLPPGSLVVSPLPHSRCLRLVGLDALLDRRLTARLVHPAIYDRLWRRFRQFSEDVPPGATPTAEHTALFALRLFTLLTRYEALEDHVADSGRNFQGALSEALFGLLRDELGVEMETFAAPQFAVFDRCLSAFPDTDRPFGSLGSFLAFRPQRGAFQAAPPNTEVVLAHAIRHTLDVFDGAAGPLLFVLFLPDWPDLPALQSLDSSPYFTHCEVIPAFAQVYESRQSDGEVKFTVVPNRSRIYVLQKGSPPPCPDPRAVCRRILALYAKEKAAATASGALATRPNRSPGPPRRHGYQVVAAEALKAWDWLNYDALQAALAGDRRFEAAAHPSNAAVLLTPKHSSGQLLNFIPGIHLVAIKSLLAEQPDFRDLVPPHSCSVTAWQVVAGELPDDVRDGPWFLKPAWVEVGGGWGVRPFPTFAALATFLAEQRAAAAERGDPKTQAELAERLTRTGYLRFRVPAQFKQCVLLRNREFDRVPPEMYFFAVAQAAVAPDLTIPPGRAERHKYDLRVFVLCWFRRRRIQRVYVLRRMLVRICPDPHDPAGLTPGTTLTTSGFDTGRSLSREGTVDEAWNGVTEGPLSLPDFLRRFSAALRRCVRPEGHGFGYLGLDVIRRDDGQLFLLEVNEHPFFRPQFKTEFFAAVADLAIVPALTGVPCDSPAWAGTFLEV
eukprot:EG_transcript_1242